jgi:hypothetical protein
METIVELIITALVLTTVFLLSAAPLVVAAALIKWLVL